jgi:hypothetical protein
MKRLALAVALLVVASPAFADEVDVPRSTAHLTVPDDWKAVRGTPLVAAYKRDDGALLAVTRADVPNADAWKKDAKKAYAESVFAGIKASLPTAKKLTMKLGETNNVPALDVEGTREGKPIVIRVLMYRTYALSLAIEGAPLDVARAIAAKFGPLKPVPKD